MTAEFNPPQPRSQAPVLTVGQVTALFEDIAVLPLDFGNSSADDGCFWRSEAVCRYLFDLGLTPKNAWAFGEGKKITVSLPDGGMTDWWYHVAPVLTVMSEQGGEEDMIFDAVLFKKPVSFAEWGSYLAVTPAEKEILDYGIVPKGYQREMENKK